MSSYSISVLCLFSLGVEDYLKLSFRRETKALCSPKEQFNLCNRLFSLLKRKQSLVKHFWLETSHTIILVLILNQEVMQIKSPPESFLILHLTLNYISAGSFCPKMDIKALNQLNIFRRGRRKPRGLTKKLTKCLWFPVQNPLPVERPYGRLV